MCRGESLKAERVGVVLASLVFTCGGAAVRDPAGEGIVGEPQDSVAVAQHHPATEGSCKILKAGRC